MAILPAIPYNQVMAFDWIKRFQQQMDKPHDYAEKTLAQYRLGMRAKGAIVGVRIVPDPAGCAASRQLDPSAVHHPDEAPHLPLPDCDKGRRCQCVYRPHMRYQQDDEEEL